MFFQKPKHDTSNFFCRGSEIHFRGILVRDRCGINTTGHPDAERADRAPLESSLRPPWRENIPVEHAGKTAQQNSHPDRSACGPWGLQACFPPEQESYEATALITRLHTRKHLFAMSRGRGARTLQQQSFSVGG